MGAGSGLLLGGCERLGTLPAVDGLLRSADGLTLAAQRLVSARDALAPEFAASDLSPVFRANGNVMPRSPEWQRHAAEGFANWRLRVGGLVERPLSLSLADLRALRPRSQITRHDCVEGWSAIGGWSGPPLGPILRFARLREQARYIVFHCADDFAGAPYYESVDLIDAFHPQTILALDLNGAPLPVPNGAPVRVRIERQLGYKHAKYLTGIEARASLGGLYGGKGGFWEDRGYEWYGGI
jgi:DMSO/TMAO reductase YedYZ molybdopterin-dependent catalytic subunit